MKKLKAAIQYECLTSVKYVWLFYLIQYAAVALITVIVMLSVNTAEEVGTNCLEFNTLIYVGILGGLGAKEDFRMLIQNGFTRRCIFLAAASMFAFICGVMALVDTAVGQILHLVFPAYSSVFGALYGYENVFANWIWLFCFYMLVCSLLYLAVLAINKAGKTISICLGVGLGAAVLVIVALFRYVVPGETAAKIAEAAAAAMGYLSDGTVNRVFPVFTMLVLAALSGAGAYAVLRRTEL